MATSSDKSGAKFRGGGSSGCESNLAEGYKGEEGVAWLSLTALAGSGSENYGGDFKSSRQTG